MAMSIADALIKTRNGRVVYMQANQIPERIRALKQLVHDTFVLPIRKGGFRPDYRQVRFDVYKASRNRIIDLAKGSEEEFDAAIAAVKFAWTSYDDYQDAINAISYPEDLDLVQESDHLVTDYESSDHYSRR